MSYSIQMQNISKRFGSITAVDNVSLDIGDNEFFALLGPSGCGKTTLLRTLAGFETPNQGKVLVGGEDITGLRPALRPLNLMFQSYALFPHMTVAKNIAYGLEMEKLPKAEIAVRVAEVMERVQLTQFADRKPDQMSGGQRQRVALARALVKRPRVLLLDEPLSALDKKLREQMQLELKRLQHEVGITFLVVTHDQQEALVMADRIAVLQDGRLEQVGSPLELYEQPQSRFVAGFIGDMNFLEGIAGPDGVEVDGIGVLRGAGKLQGPAVIAVRPERLALVPVDPGDGRNSVTGTVIDSAYHGAEIAVHIKLEKGNETFTARVHASQAQHANIQPGAAICCAWEPEHSRILAAGK